MRHRWAGGFNLLFLVVDTHRCLDFQHNIFASRILVIIIYKRSVTRTKTGLAAHRRRMAETHFFPKFAGTISLLSRGLVSFLKADQGSFPDFFRNFMSAQITSDFSCV